MKLKLYFSLLLATLMMSLSFVSCEKTDNDVDEPNVVIPANPLSLAIEGSTIEDLKVKISINSGVDIDNYVVGVAEQSAYASSLSSDSLKLATFIIEDLESKDVDFAKADNTYVFSSGSTVDLASAWELAYDTEYVVAAFAVDAEGSLMSGVNHVNVTTDVEPAPEILADAFQVEIVDITSVGANAIVTPVEEIENYYVICQPYSLMDEYSDGDPSAFYELVLESAKMAMTDFSEPNGYSIFTGTKTIDVTACYGDDLDSNTQYIFAVAAVDANGGILSEVSFVDFTTEVAVEKIENAFTFEITDNSIPDVKFTITPSEEVPYYIASAILKSTLDSGYEGSVSNWLTAYADQYLGMANVAELIDYEIAQKSAWSTSLMNTAGSASENTEYVIAAIGVDANNNYITYVESYSLTTPTTVVEPEIIEDAFSFETLSSTESEISVKVTPLESVPYYFMSAISTKALATGYGADASYYINNIASTALAGSTDMEALVEAGSLYKGELSVNLSSLAGTLYSDTEYILVTLGVDQSGEVITTASSYKEYTAAPLPSDAFAIELTDLSSTGATINVTPDSVVGNYYVVCQTYETMVNFADGDAATLFNMLIANDLMMGTTDFAEPNNITLYSGSKSIDPTLCLGSELTAATAYVFIVAGVDATGALTTEVESLNFTSKDENNQDVDPFTITLGEVTSSDATVTITPANGIPYYYATAIPTATLDQYYEGNVVAYAEENAKYYLSINDIPTLISKNTLHSGAKSLNFTDLCGALTPETEYQFAVVGVSASGDLQGTMSLNVTTISDAVVDPSDATITLTLGEITKTDAGVTVTPSADVPYYYVNAISSEFLESNYEGSMTKFLNEGISYFLSMGAGMDTLLDYGMIENSEKEFRVKDYFGQLSPDTKYQFGAMGLNAEGEMICIESIEFTTEADEVVVPEPTVTLTLGEITTSDATVTVTPSADVPYYYAHAISTEYLEKDYAGDFAAYLNSGVSYLLSYGMGLDVLAQYDMVSYGEKEFHVKDFFGQLSSGTEYQFGVMGLNAEGEMLCVEKVVFTTAADVVEPDAAPFTLTVSDITSSDATITVAPADDVLYYYAYTIPDSWLNSLYNGDILAGLQDELVPYAGATASQLLPSGRIYAGEKVFSAGASLGQLSANTKYHFAIIALNEAMEQLEYMSVEFTTLEN
ncbi:MAG: hypothetical protein R3Y08_00205 [Rikenellaceae bacterium]